MIFHPLNTTIAKPDKFTYPFCYTPHPLCLLASAELQRYLVSVDSWRDEIGQGKMFGVLVAEDADGRLGFLAAYSGILAGRNDWPYFVPSVYDALQPDGYFKIHESEITRINRRVDELENDSARVDLLARLQKLKSEAETEISGYKKSVNDAKARRDASRAQGELTDEQQAAMIRESQYMKAELHRLKLRYAAEIAEVEKTVEVSDEAIEHLKRQRKQMSDDLQQWLFGQFDMLNARGEHRNLCSIFAETANGVPPSGAGECCAPKLLQYAYLHDLHPVCMSEFWWGESPKTEIRHHLHYYPACQGKCKPILAHMLKGLDVDDNPLEQSMTEELKIVYDDEWISVVNKPAGMLSVPGRSDRVSVLSIMHLKYPQYDGPMMVHRLDMATSGLLVVAKSKQVHQHLQSQFKRHEVKKRYVAILDGRIDKAQGTIALPLSADYLDRPRQIVDTQHGKTAITDYRVISEEGNRTKIALYPQTGRTHQLRVHCAHRLGLHTPILGDALYGHPADRLYLHAESISFVHPVTGEEMHLECPADF